MKDSLKPWLPHVIAILVFVLIGVVYFSPVLEGKRLKQGDIKNFQGMAKEIRDHRALFDEEPLWTNSMFGGMPAYQIAIQYPGQVLKYIDDAFQLWTPRPMNYVLLYMIGFYILMMAMRVNPWLAIVGSVAFAFSSYFFIILEAGHNTKAHAIGYLAPTLAGIIWAYRGKLLLGGAMTAFFVALQVQANHVQITYYFGILALFYGIAKLVEAVRDKQIMEWVKPSAVLVLAGLIGIMCNVANLWNTYEYGKHTTRGETELTILPGGESNEAIATSGLDREYVTRWSYGIGETLSLVIPNAKGGATGLIGPDNDHLDAASPQYRQNIAQSNQYWGDQPFTSGPVYVGALIVYLFVLGMVFLKGHARWAILATVILTIMLSWGKNFMGLTDFFLDYVPGYNKFRAVTIILAITELAFPLLAIWFADRLLKEPELIANQKKKFYIATGSVLGVILVLAAAPDSFLSFLSEQEMDQFGRQMNQGGQAAAMGAFMDDLEAVRISIFRADAFRSFGFIAVGAVLLFLHARKTLSTYAVIGALFVLVIVDMWSVNKRYLNNEKDRGRYVQWEDSSENLFPYVPNAADMGVLQTELSDPTGLLRMAGEEYTERQSFDEHVQLHQQHLKELKQEKAGIMRPLTEEEEQIAQLSALNFRSDFRVLNLNNPFNDGRTPYFHKAVGGYHGAKLRRFQELIDFHLGAEVQRISGVFGNEPTQEKLFRALGESTILNMLNTRYLIYNPGAPPLPNAAAYGSAWIVDELELVEDADAEILALGDLDPLYGAVADKKYADYFEGQTEYTYDSLATVDITSYKPNELTYDFQSSETQLVVFSEIHYPDGWQAYLDGEPVDHARVNYVLRAMKVPAGEHTIVFKFEPAAYTSTAGISTAFSIIVLLLAAFGLFRHFRGNRPTETEA